MYLSGSGINYQMSYEAARIAFPFQRISAMKLHAGRGGTAHITICLVDLNVSHFAVSSAPHFARCNKQIHKVELQAGYERYTKRECRANNCACESHTALCKRSTFKKYVYASSAHHSQTLTSTVLRRAT